MTVTGVGGVFFRSEDPDALSKWYREYLGVGLKYGMLEQTAGPALIVPFAKATDYFPADKAWMLNLRVEDIDGFIAKLRQSGIEVKTDPAWNTPETGKFARIHDPEGNAIELWEPPAD